MTAVDETTYPDLGDPNWWNWANCRGAPLEVFITPGDDDDEPPYPSPKAKSYCGECWVKANCLKWALDHDIDSGVWGGMSAYQRSQITRRVKERKHCPGCGSTDIVAENKHEICLACGVSWDVL